MNKIFSTLLAFLSLVACLEGAAQPTAAQFKELCGVAQDMDHTTAGMNYEEYFTQAVQDQLRDALKVCASRATPPLEVDIVFVIARDGKVEHIFSDPNQPVSACVAGRLERLKVPPPPRAEWMQLVNIYIKQ